MWAFFLKLLAFFGLFLSVAIPGVGWVIASITLIAASISVTLVDKKSLAFVFIVNCLHLFSFGPFSILSASSRIQIWPLSFGLLFLVIVPFVIAIFAFNKRL